MSGSCIASPYRRTKHPNFHVRGYKEKANINTPMELGAHAKNRFRNMQIGCRNYPYKQGTDYPEITGWKWPF